MKVVARMLVVVGLLAAGCADAAEPVVLFNGKDLSGWKPENFTQRHFWKVGTASVAGDKKLSVAAGGNELVLPEFGADLVSERTFGDQKIELAVMLPPASNSGIYVMGEYEVQVLDDANAPPGTPDDMKHGAIPGVSAPKVAAGKPAGEWQTYEIIFRAPRFDAAGKKTAHAKFEKITINGKVVQENVEVPESSIGARTFEEKPTGPLMLQGAEGGVAYREIRVTPLE